jgi:Right handed beta helix region
VSGFGADTNPCTLPQPCRTFQRAHDIVPANALIEALDPAGYQLLVISKGISIQGHGYSSIFQTGSGAAITISVTTSDPVTLNGLVLDGGGTGQYGINITSGPSVLILNSVVRHFVDGIHLGTAPPWHPYLLVEDTIVSDNSGSGINVFPNDSAVRATFNRITANNNTNGLKISGSSATIANSVISNNSSTGLTTGSGVSYLAKNVISGNTTGVATGARVYSYGDNYIASNGTPVVGSLTPVGMQ